MLVGQREIELEGLLRRLIEAVQDLNTELFRDPEERDEDVISRALAEESNAINEAEALGVRVLR